MPLKQTNKKQLSKYKFNSFGPHFQLIFLFAIAHLQLKYFVALNRATFLKIQI